MYIIYTSMLNFIMIKNRSKLEWNGEYGYQLYIKIIQEENKMKVVTSDRFF